MKRLLIALSLVLCAAVAAPALAEHGKKGKEGKRKGHGPDRIALPDGWRPEGIATGKRDSFYVGSIGSGDIYRGSLRTGEGKPVVDAPADRSAIGIKVDRRGRVFVAGGANVPGKVKGIWVYDTRTGGQVASYPIPTAGFINDVVLTKRAAYFTDSLVPVLYKVPIARDGSLGALQTIPITGELVYTPGFNVNGIEAAKRGKTLILVKSNSGELFTADAATGATRKIAVTGGDAELENGDGILRKGRKLYVSENQDVNSGRPGTGEVTTVKLRRDLSSGRIVREVSSEHFDVTTTLARWHGRLFAVNARFNTEPTPDTEYWVAKVPKR
jgi:hypothetical protein